ncbi:MAG: helix-turn-helix transcriptional regulator [Deltaproteobacteria bacterium]|nr:helix-turn-helix transcriptional regulator [Deltaproteobacteria bacterium]
MGPHEKNTQIGIVEIIRQRIRRLRLQRQFTQEDLCERAGISVDAVSRIENGSRVPTLDTLEKIAAALGVRIVDLVTTTEVRGPQIAPSIQSIVNLLERYPAEVHKTAEKVIKAMVKGLPAGEVARAAAEDGEEYRTPPRKRR